MKVAFSGLLLCLLLVSSNLSGQVVPEVRVKPIKDIASYPLRDAPATIVSLNESTISAEIASTIVDIPVLVGDVVKQGVPLVKLDCLDFELVRDRTISGLEALNARKKWAEKRLDRTQRLNLEESASEEELDNRQLEVTVLNRDIESASAVLSQAIKNISRCVIKSPLNAVVTSRQASLGEYANPGMPLIQLVDIENIEVSAQVGSSEIDLIKSAKNIQFSFAEKQYPLTLRTILPVINTNSRDYEIRLTFARGQGPAGAAGKLVWKDSRPHISGDYIVEREGELGVFVERAGKAEFYPVTGARPGRITAIDLSVDSNIIIEGHYALEKNSDIKVID